MSTPKTASKPLTQTVPKRFMWTGTRAIAEAVKLADVDVIAAYPIRPYTGVMNSLAKMLADGEFAAEIIGADSEHSQFEIAKHASAVGARTFVGSSGVGLAYAAEPIVVTAMGQLPVVAMAGCRALDDPGNFGMEWNDVLTFRDHGWLMSWAKDPQEALDMTLVAYRVSEDRRVLLPSFVAVDGAAITHISAPVEPPSREQVAKFLPPYKPQYPLDPAYGPITKAQHIAPSLIGPELRKVVDNAMAQAREVIQEAWKDFAGFVGREYPPFIEKKYIEDAEIALVTMGAYSKDAVHVATKLRQEGVKVGVVRMRYFRPFPQRELAEALGKVKAVGVVDFSYSFGSADSSSVLFNEVRSALYESGSRPLLMDFMFVGGREPSVEHFEQAVRLLQKGAEKGAVEKHVWWPTLRGESP
ncbi:MAG: transketolase C-terminal domain-containing protein [Candidatus Bathyarchaeia archaeon]